MCFVWSVMVNVSDVKYYIREEKNGTQIGIKGTESLLQI